VRQIAMILVFDLGGPLLVYSLVRSAGLSTVAALIVSGIPPAQDPGAPAAVTADAERRG
jgi:hypothetical protein